MQVFVERLKRDVRAIAMLYDRIVGILPLTDTEKQNHAMATTCSIYDQIFLDQNGKVADYCHQTGKYRGAAHSSCNIRFQTPNFVPIIMHNFSNYDAHLIVTSLSSDDDNNNSIKVVAKTKEKYISLQNI